MNHDAQAIDDQKTGVTDKEIEIIYSDFINREIKPKLKKFIDSKVCELTNNKNGVDIVLDGLSLDHLYNINSLIVQVKIGYSSDKIKERRKEQSHEIFLCAFTSKHHPEVYSIPVKHYNYDNTGNNKITHIKPFQVDDAPSFNFITQCYQDYMNEKDDGTPNLLISNFMSNNTKPEERIEKFIKSLSGMISYSGCKGVHSVYKKEYEDKFGCKPYVDTTTVSPIQADTEITINDSTLIEVYNNFLDNKIKPKLEECINLIMHESANKFTDPNLENIAFLGRGENKLKVYVRFNDMGRNAAFNCLYMSKKHQSYQNHIETDKKRNYVFMIDNEDITSFQFVTTCLSDGYNKGNTTGNSTPVDIHNRFEKKYVSKIIQDAIGSTKELLNDHKCKSSYDKYKRKYADRPYFDLEMCKKDITSAIKEITENNQRSGIDLALLNTPYQNDIYTPPCSKRNDLLPVQGSTSAVPIVGIISSFVFVLIMFLTVGIIWRILINRNYNAKNREVSIVTIESDKMLELQTETTTASGEPSTSLSGSSTTESEGRSSSSSTTASESRNSSISGDGSRSNSKSSYLLCNFLSKLIR